MTLRLNINGSVFVAIPLEDLPGDVEATPDTIRLYDHAFGAGIAASVEAYGQELRAKALAQYRLREALSAIKWYRRTVALLLVCLLASVLLSWWRISHVS